MVKSSTGIDGHRVFDVESVDASEVRAASQV